jgi:hypothetical protein
MSVGPRIWVWVSPRMVQGYSNWAHYRSWVKWKAKHEARKALDKPVR